MTWIETDKQTERLKERGGGEGRGGEESREGWTQGGRERESQVFKNCIIKGYK